jgi:sugar phosphate isomerase/epimerase
MTRPVTLFTGQWADLPIAELVPRAAAMGFDGLELACWGDHFDVRRALHEPGYTENLRTLLARHGLTCSAISNHLVGQAVCDPIDHRHRAILPWHVWGDGDPEGVRGRAAEEMMLTARAARAFGAEVVNGFTGSAVWHMFYFFPPTSAADIERGFRDFADRWNPILDVFGASGVRFALEVHPTEIAYDTPTAQRALDAVGRRPEFGFNFDPSHLLWQGVDPAGFVERFADRIYHVHMKDVARRSTAEVSLLGGHLQFGDPRRAWDFRSVGRGEIDFDAIIRALNRARYIGPLSVEWEDPDMDREHGATESAAYVRSIDFSPADRAFDSAFDSGNGS